MNLRALSSLWVLPLTLTLGAVVAAGQPQPDPAEAERQRRADSAATFTPTRVHLKATGTPLAEVVVDLARQAGVPLYLAREPADLAVRPVTIDTGETTFWEALDALCRQAQVSIQPGEFDPAIVDSLRLPPSAALLVQRGAEEVLVLQDGLLPACPMAYLGAVRVRLILDSWANRGRKAGDEYRRALEVLSEPRIDWQGVPGFQFEPVAGLAINRDPQTPLKWGANYIGGMVRSDNVATLRPVTRYELPVYLRAEPSVGRTVADLHGTLTGTVRLGDHLTLTIADVQKAGVAEAIAPDGTKLRVLDRTMKALGAVTLTMEVERPAVIGDSRDRRNDHSNGWGGNGGQVSNDVVTSILAGYGRDGEVFCLFDTQDRPYKTMLRISEVSQEKAITTTKYMLDGEPAAPDAQPRKLELDVPRRAMVEAKFTLRDVPLP